MIRAPPTAPPSLLTSTTPLVAPDAISAPNHSSVATVAAVAAAAAAKRAAVQVPISPPAPPAPPAVPSATPESPVPFAPSDSVLSDPNTSPLVKRIRDDFNLQALEAARLDDLVREDYLATSKDAVVTVPEPKRATRRKKSTASRKRSAAKAQFLGVIADKPAAAADADNSTITSGKDSSGNDSVRSYLKEIGEVKLLDADKEITLARQIARLLTLERISARFKSSHGRHPTIDEWAKAASTDPGTLRTALRSGLRAREHMVAANLRLVVSIAKRYLNRGLTFQDLIQEGSIGLIRGAEKFDGNKGFKFSTYATWWIRQAITRAIADHSRTIRLPVHVNDTIAAIRKTSKNLYVELSRAPTECEIAERMQISVEKLRFLTKSSRSTLSLETPIGRDMKDSSATLGSFIEWNGDTPEDAIMKSLLREDLENVLNTLSPRERDVVRMRYGFDDGKMKTLEEIGSIFAVTRERIRQIEAKALRKLRHPTRNAVLREYVYEK
ncbi:RNA polymerase sigma-70 [Gracilaria domingensis]|nr:RNA polymerase sigma-70 [Gracilaria domingensis]